MPAGPKLTPVQSGVAGEYLVAAELSRLGYVASLTLRSTKGIDMLVSDAEANASAGIQVKTSQRSEPRWLMKRLSDEELADNLFFVFVCLGAEPRPT